MTDEQWRGCASPETMLNALSRQYSPRKLRLYAVGCCRRIWHLFTDERCRHAVEVAQRFADGRAGEVELHAAAQLAATVASVWGDATSLLARAEKAVGGAAWAATRQPAWHAAWDAGYNARRAARDFVPGADWELERAWQAELLRDLVRGPDGLARLEPAWLAHESQAAVKLARVIYDEGRFGDLPILADALEEAGCGDEAVLGHCRARQVHHRGCWVVDAALGWE